MTEPTVDEHLVARLLADQHPDLAGLPLTRAGSGWDNVVYRLGPDLAVRLPTRAEAAVLTTNEQRWLPSLLAGLPGAGEGGLDAWGPIRTGGPAPGYPWPWSIGPWLRGGVLAEHPVDDPVDAGARLGRFLAAFHRPAPADAPPNPYRGTPLADRLPLLEAALDRLDDLGRPLHRGMRRAAVVDRVATLAQQPPWGGPPQWLHGDPHALNLLVVDGALHGIIDFGDLTAGDPASDLAACWLVLEDEEARTAFRQAVGHNEATWRRAEGWALALAVASRAGSPPGSPLLPIGDRVIRELLVA